MITRLKEIAQKVKTLKSKRLSVACGEDPHTIEAVAQAVKEGIVRAVLTGDREKIIKVADQHQVDSSLFEIDHEPEMNKALVSAISKVRTKECDFLMKGLIDSAPYMHAILEESKKSSSSGQIVSHVSVIELPTYFKLLTVSDIAVIPYPDLKQKIAMLNYSIDVAHKLGIERPKSALICAVEKVNPKMNPTVEAALIAKMAERGQIKGSIVDGPLSLDLA
ncbi:MAG: phosphate butyryltransferase, partial [Candidatus Aureabacteria bacterium]|nr:phosphate butyryltransferase [Candidatus Auribacterota bacterium]